MTRGHPNLSLSRTGNVISRWLSGLSGAIVERATLRCFTQQPLAPNVAPTEPETGCRNAGTTILPPQHTRHCVESAGEPGDTILA